MSDYLQQLQRDASSTAVKLPACVVILLNENAEFLLIKETARQQWQLPLDGIRDGETATEATLRLTRQQLGVEPAELECIGYSSADPANKIIWPAQNILVQLHAFVMVSTDWQGDISPATDYDSAQYFGIRDLPPVPAHVEHHIQMFTSWLPNREFQFR